MYSSGQAVLRLRTHGSVYHLAFLQGNEQGARLAVLQGTSEGVEGVVEGQSADPRVGTRSLWDVPVPSWIGQCLVVGSVTTTPIEGVGREMDADRAEGITSALRAVARKLGAAVPTPGQGAEGARAQPAWRAEAAVVELELATLHLCGSMVQRLASHPTGDAELRARALTAVERSQRALAELAAALGVDPEPRTTRS